MDIDSRQYSPMTVGNWLLTFVILALPFIGFIMQLVWAFSEETHPSKKTFCQASLILLLIAMVLGGVFFALFMVFAAKPTFTPLSP